MRVPFFLFPFLIFSLYADNAFQEQTPLPMAPSSAKETHALWLPITAQTQPTASSNTSVPSKSIHKSIQQQIKKKMEAILKPMTEDEEHF